MIYFGLEVHNRRFLRVAFWKFYIYVELVAMIRSCGGNFKKK